MKVFMLFAFQIILLTGGFSIGYLVLITASANKGALKSIGNFLGWILIVMTMLLTICSFLYSLKIANTYNRKVYCPINGPAQQQIRPLSNKQEKIKKQQYLQGDQDGPIKHSVNDHE